MGNVPIQGLGLASQDDLADSLGLEACGLRLLADEVHAWRQRLDIIRAGMKVQHLAARDIEQLAFRRSPLAIRRQEQHSSDHACPRPSLLHLAPLRLGYPHCGRFGYQHTSI